TSNASFVASAPRPRERTALSAKNLKSLPHWYSYTEVAKQTVGWCVVCVLGVMCAVAMMLVFF
ncbi:hypothetical protein HMPREF3208_00453, partial [Gardnerella vaginalis]